VIESIKHAILNRGINQWAKVNSEQAVGIIPKYLAAFDSTNHYVMKSAGGSDACLSRRAKRTEKAAHSYQSINQYPSPPPEVDFTSSRWYVLVVKL
jgi:hypothetical protein